MDRTSAKPHTDLSRNDGNEGQAKQKGKLQEKEKQKKDSTLGDVLDLPGGGIGEEPFGDLRFLLVAELLRLISSSSVRHWREARQFINWKAKFWGLEWEEIPNKYNSCKDKLAEGGLITIFPHFFFGL
ncbi:hypothetical protein BHE74_00059004 [Ensete ventricosum]|nr:hypothetical protein GW17_00041477 [Ensete ventricosum]RWW36002.1 hypothetical protein BHE74_00059004 [Ensete ventricosum]RZS26655.1 hypothetical protein BHM03_00060020 [Ensete ventricosum]